MAGLVVRRGFNLQVFIVILESVAVLKRQAELAREDVEMRNIDPYPRLPVPKIPELTFCDVHHIGNSLHSGRVRFANELSNRIRYGMVALPGLSSHAITFLRHF